MDRLICGDVGYGKTEIAMRAAMRAVVDAKQVAVLAPTTILAFQHWKTFRTRFAPFPVRVENVVIASCSGRDCPRGTMVVAVTILVPSGVMSVFPGLKVMTPARFGNVTTSLADRRLPPGAVVSRTRTCAVLWNFPPHCWNARSGRQPNSRSPASLAQFSSNFGRHLLATTAGAPTSISSSVG